MSHGWRWSKLVGLTISRQPSRTTSLLQSHRIIDDRDSRQAPDHENQRLNGPRPEENNEKQSQLQSGHGLAKYSSLKRRRRKARNESCHYEADRSRNIPRQKDEILASTDASVGEVRRHGGEDKKPVCNRIDQCPRNCRAVAPSRSPPIEKIRCRCSNDQKDTRPWLAENYERQSEKEAGKRDAVGKCEDFATLHPPKLDVACDACQRAG